MCAHGELVTDGFLLRFELVFFILVQCIQALFLGLVCILFSVLDTLALLSVVRVLKDFIDLTLQVIFVLFDEILLLLVKLSINVFLSLLSLLLDLLGMLLLLEFAAAIETFLQNSVQFLLLALLVCVHQA